MFKFNETEFDKKRKENQKKDIKNLEKLVKFIDEKSVNLKNKNIKIRTDVQYKNEKLYKISMYVYKSKNFLYCKCINRLCSTRYIDDKIKEIENNLNLL